MQESFLHYIWQFQQFDKAKLLTTEGEEVQIYSTGTHNSNAGPDFENAKVRIGNIDWHGQVEIHTSSSYWQLHGHQKDAAYENVILHVVWQEDEPIFNSDKKRIPTIELKNRISEDLLKRCNELINSPDVIPCSSQIAMLKSMERVAMQEQAGIERLQDKSQFVFDLLHKNKGNWEETAYQLVAKNYGFKINSESFLRLAENLPLKILKKHSGNLMQVEALLFGMAGFLDETPKDHYHLILMNEYAFLAKKYSLEGNELHHSNWKYLRLRPGNFPSVRLAQLAAFINSNAHVFDCFLNAKSIKQAVKLQQHKVSDYWQSHYSFGSETDRKLKSIGLASIENLIINTTAPLLAAYAQHVDDQKFMDQAIDLLTGIKNEKNKIITQWEGLGLKSQNAFESQALIQLYNTYCLKKKCLSCKIGVALINSK
ncbi:MAG: DUF2851 family protein [Cyclobacteriaceae bacterium]